MKMFRVWDGYQMNYQDTSTEELPCMRATGEDDGGGKSIYECDILERGAARGVVEYNEYDMRFSVRFGMELVPLNEGMAFTVVGNAFETPNRI